MSARIRLRIRRRGTTTVEAAFVLPVFFTFMLGLFEVCHAQMVNNLLKSACTKGARYAAVDGTTEAETIAYMKSFLASGMNANNVTIRIKDASALDDGQAVPSTATAINAMPNANLADMEERTLFLIYASTNYADVAVIKVPFIPNIALAGTSISRHE